MKTLIRLALTVVSPYQTAYNVIQQQNVQIAQPIILYYLIIHVKDVKQEPIMNHQIRRVLIVVFLWQTA